MDLALLRRQPGRRGIIRTCRDCGRIVIALGSRQGIRRAFGDPRKAVDISRRLLLRGMDGSRYRVARTHLRYERPWQRNGLKIGIGLTFGVRGASVEGGCGDGNRRQVARAHLRCERPRRIGLARRARRAAVKGERKAQRGGQPVPLLEERNSYHWSRRRKIRVQQER